MLISLITWMEVLVGARGEDARLRDFMEAHFEIAPVDKAVAEEAIRLRRAHRLRLPAAVICATATTSGAVLVSGNTKDLNPAWEGIRVPYTL